MSDSSKQSAELIIANEDLLRAALVASVRLAIMRHDIQLEPDTATEEEVAADAAGACFGEQCCDNKPIPEVAELLRRMANKTASSKPSLSQLSQDIVKAVFARVSSGSWNRSLLRLNEPEAAAEVQGMIEKWMEER